MLHRMSKQQSVKNSMVKKITDVKNASVKKP